MATVTGTSAGFGAAPTMATGVGGAPAITGAHTGLPGKTPVVGGTPLPPPQQPDGPVNSLPRNYLEYYTLWC